MSNDIEAIESDGLEVEDIIRRARTGVRDILKNTDNSYRAEIVKAIENERMIILDQKVSKDCMVERNSFVMEIMGFAFGLALLMALPLGITVSVLSDSIEPSLIFSSTVALMIVIIIGISFFFAIRKTERETNDVVIRAFREGMITEAKYHSAKRYGTALTIVAKSYKSGSLDESIDSILKDL